MWDWNIFRWNHEIYKFWNNKPPGNDGLTAEFCKHFPNELAPVLLDVYDFWGKFDTMGVTYRTGIISAIYKDIANYIPISLLSLDYKIYTIY